MMLRFKKSIVCSCIMLFSLLTYAQDVTGVVLNKDDGLSVIGATIQIKGKPSIIASTDLDGVYYISADATDTLVFSCIGMNTVEVPVEGRTVINLTMEFAAEILDELIVVAYGSAKKESFTGSAEVVSSEKLASRPVTDVTKMLDGQVAGVMSTSGSGQPGSGADICIRGFGSINASNSPLLVVDGMPYDGNLSSISTNDIESMTVLKDASAGALYGSRGANGVIIITTKKAKRQDKLSVKFSTKLGASHNAISPYNTLDQYAYMETMYNAYYNDLVTTQGYLPYAAKEKVLDLLSNSILGVDNIYNPFQKDINEVFDINGKIDRNIPLKYNENWMKATQAEFPLRQDYQLSVSGGSEKVKYLASVGYVNENGTLITTNFIRYNARANVDFKPTEWFDFGMNASYSHINSNFMGASGSNINNVWFSSQLIAPIYPVYQKSKDGNNMYDDNGGKMFDYGMSRPAGAQNNRNCIATLFDDKYYTYSDVASVKSYLGVNWKGFSLKTNIGVDNSNEYETTYYNRHSGNATGTGRLTKENGRSFSYTWNQLLSYNQTFGKFNADILLGHEFYSHQFNYFTAQRIGFLFDNFYELATGSTIIDGNSVQENYSIDSYLARANLSYDDRYYFSVSYRMDASSRFKKENRWGSFWSVGGSWRISQEDFLKNVNWINNITLKCSYGVQGNDNIGTYYAWQAFYDINYPNTNMAGGIIGSIENKNITWEKNGNLNVGLEFRFFNKLYGTVEFYNRRTSDLLINYPMPVSSGFEGYYANVGKIDNTGMDISLGYTVLSNQSCSWNVSLMGSFLKNKVVQLVNDDSPIINGNYLIKVGKELNSFYMAKSAGVDPANGKQLYYAYKKDEHGNMIPDSEYITADATVAANCKYNFGSRIPKVYGSINSSLTYKNFDFQLLFTYSIGGKIYDAVYKSMMEPQFPGVTYHRNVLRSWKKPGDVTDVPIVTTTSSSISNDRFLVNASYFAIKNISLGYNIPKFKIQNFGIENIRIFLTADSPFIFTHLKGMNPQANFLGTTSYEYSPSKSLTLGIDIKF